MPWPGSFLRKVIIKFDTFLSRVEGVYTYTDDPDCILRLRRAKSSIKLNLPNGDIGLGDDVLEIHLWNEHMPKLKENDSNLGWGTRTLHLFLHSLRDVAGILQENPQLSEVKAIRGEMIFLGTAENPGRARQMERLGFTVIPYHGKLRGFGEFWENFYSWWLMWAYNPVSTRSRRLNSSHRMQMWMSRAKFLEIYGKSKGID
jgi:hypothetical protein